MPAMPNVLGMGRSLWAALACAGLLALIVATPADAEHCETGIVLYGRSALAPGVLPPVLPRYCVALQTSGSAGHILLPGTEQVFVRVEANLGGSYPLLVLKLDGLGFDDQTFQLVRTLNTGATWTYNLEDWLTLPDPEAGGTLEARVRFPGNYDATARYTLLGVQPRE